MEVITVTLLSVRIGQELAVVDLIRSRVLWHLRFRNLPHLLIRSHHLVDVLLGGMVLLRGFLRLAGIGAAVVGAVGIVGIVVCIAGGAAAIAGIAIIAERHVVKVHFRPRIVGIRIGDAVIRLLGQTMNGESQCDGHHNERDHNGHDLGGELAEQFGIGDLGRTGGRGFRGKARRHRNGGSVFVLICRVDRFLLRLQRACGFLARLDDPSVRSDHRNATGLLQLRIVRMIIALRRRRGNTDGEGERRIHIFGGSVEVLFAE